MLHSMKDLEGYSIGATDGMIGHVQDFYFDDAAWVIRYLVVETGSWLSHRRVLVSPSAINQPDWAGRSFPAAITREQVQNSPGIDTDKPVSRQHEIGYLDYYRYPHYWSGGDFWGDGRMWLGNESAKPAAPPPTAGADPQLRSRNEVVGYDVIAADGHIGHVQELLLDETGWAIRFIVVNTSNWWSGHRVVIAPQWITGVSWDERSLAVSLARDTVRASPPYAPGIRMTRDEEARIYHHYDKPAYWARQVQMENPEFRDINRS